MLVYNNSIRFYLFIYFVYVGKLCDNIVKMFLGHFCKILTIFGKLLLNVLKTFCIILVGMFRGLGFSISFFNIFFMKVFNLHSLSLLSLTLEFIFRY